MTLRAFLKRARASVRPPSGGTTSVLAASSGIVAIGAVYLYFFGYIFEYFYYQAFGVTIESLDLSPQYYFVHAYTGVESRQGLLVVTPLILIVYTYSIGLVRRGLLVASVVSTK
jgi:hypothetical protein